ncbi:hypothetical protein O6H91_02G119800 [Diphasiastrum complanatum]|uniref:Uncharacterized protein n=1 Tax=Diphasiastrum complanatum TaxID=34168 RepID=A0ACC2EJU8_DIPCM|nr:hypothetical protein O6H91_02G119800 [Diphasiastrum complanatum]
MIFADDPSSHASSTIASLHWLKPPPPAAAPPLRCFNFSSECASPEHPQMQALPRPSSKGSKGLDSQLWHACAGGMVQLPCVGTKVIYFPQGHAEQSATLPHFPCALAPSPTLPCRVLSVKFLADVETDEVYARMRLQPEPTFAAQQEQPPAAAAVAEQIEKPASFAKTLTQSDANNGGGFSVPRYCAETIFPRLDYSVDPPVQTVLAKDVHGEVWKFRHIYRGTPRRHLLTTGWSTFVNQKKLVAGDAIVFLRSASGELRVGVRRSMRAASVGNGSDGLSWHTSAPAGVSGHPRPLSRWEMKPQPADISGYSEFLATSDAGRPGSTSSFARNRARVTAKSVLEAATLAAAGEPFEVIYYPRASTAEFCVRAQAVKASLDHNWYPGMRFKMAFETEDSSRISWFMGTISAVQPADPIFWPNSPWRLLQVSWDEPDLLQGVSRVSPWQVELVSTVPMQLPPFSLPKKKFRVAQPPEFQMSENQGFMGLSMATLANSVLGQVNPWHSFSSDVPAGMQGARHEQKIGLSLSEFQPNQLPSGFIEAFKLREHKNLLAGGTESARSTPPSWTGISTNRSAPFLLFGKAIDPMHTAKDQPQLSGSSSSEGNSCHDSQENSPLTQASANSSFDGSYTDTVEKVDGHSHGSKIEGADSQLPQEGRDCNYANEIGGLKWYKEQVSMMKSEKKQVLERSIGDSKMHCKIFLESEEIGRTVDLSLYETYEELYDRLANLFSTDKSKLSGRVVYKDLEGSTIHIGGEPYRNFMQTVRRLTILSEPGSDTISKVQLS